MKPRSRGGFGLDLSSLRNTIVLKACRCWLLLSTTQMIARDHSTMGDCRQQRKRSNRRPNRLLSLD